MNKNHDIINPIDKDTGKALAFVMRHPMTKYMPRKMFEANGTLKRSVTVNVIFTDMNALFDSLLFACAVEFKFAKQADDSLEDSPVFFYAPSTCSNSVRLIKQSELNFGDCDFSHPERVCELRELPSDIASIMTENSFTYIFADDKNQLDLSGVLGAFAVFDRTDVESLPDMRIELAAQAVGMSGLYKKTAGEQNIVKRDRDGMPEIERLSNLYHVAGYPFKLGLIGLDAAYAGDARPPVAKSEYAEAYGGNDDGYTDYEYFFGTERANVLAFIEHSRWNAVYMLCGFKQMKRDDIELVNTADGAYNFVHKNIAKKTHACITTYRGLDEVIRYEYGLLCTAFGATVGNAELIKIARLYAYDYMDMDSLYENQSEFGFIIVKA